MIVTFYNLKEYSSHYSEKKHTGSFWIYSKDEATDFNADIVNTNNFNSFMCKAKFLENTKADGANRILKNAIIAVLLKYLSNSWRSLEMTLIICKAELKLKWTKSCILSTACADNINERDSNNIIFTIKDTKLYVLVVALSASDNQKLLKRFNKGFKRSVSW